MRTLGPKYRKLLNEIRQKLSELDGSAAMKELDETGLLKLSVSTGEISLERDDVLIETEQTEGFYTLTENGVTVALDTTLTPELVEEGFVREIVSKIQTMRKNSGFEVMDHINITISGNDKLAEVVMKNREQISSDVLAESIASADEADGTDWEINGEKVNIKIEKA